MEMEPYKFGTGQSGGHRENVCYAIHWSAFYKQFLLESNNTQSRQTILRRAHQTHVGLSSPMGNVLNL